MSLPSISIVKPPQAALGAQPQSKTAYDTMSTSNRNQAFQLERTRLGPPEQYIRPAISPQLSSGVTRLKPVDVNTSNPISFAFETPGVLAADLTDADLDQLPDKFERRLANAFTPFYYVSAGEPNVFATFVNQPTLAIATLGVATPPISHNRVTRLGISNGIGWLQLDYLTVWNRDNGLSISSLCATLSAGLGLTIAGLGAHDFDEERSAVLIGAPTVGNSYSTELTVYKAYDYYLAAHEGVVPFDHSAYYAPQSPVPAGQHVELALSLAKHGTYPFNPNSFPIFRGEIIAAVFATISALYAGGQIDYTTYLALLYAANTVFFECVVERFTKQGGAYASTRINVGELNTPINGSSWINDPRIRTKLTPNLWVV